MRDGEKQWDAWREGIIGLGVQSSHKSYYPELQKRMADLKRFRVLLDYATDAIFLANSDTGQLVDINESACSLLDYGRQELLARSLFDLISLDDLQLFVGENAAEGSSVHARRVSMPRKDGSEVPVEIGARVASFEGRPYYIVSVRDLRERIRLESQLQQAQKMDSIGRLAGGVAHDFNNMLTGIQGNTDLALLELSEDHPVRALLLEVRRASESATALTRQLLTFSRKQVVEPRPIDLNLLIESMHRMLRRLIGENILCEFLAGSSLHQINADPNQIEHAIVNLAVNARDAMPNGGKLTIETCNVVLGNLYCGRHIGCRPGEYVRLAITDTGVGMSEDTRRHVFEPFFTTKAAGLGTGLGLATVYGTVTQAGGSIELYSEPFLGTVFKLYFPRHVVSEARAIPPSSAAASAAVAASAESEIPCTGTETVLIVEDERLVADLASRVLERLGYRVVTCNCGEDALAVAASMNEKIDLLVTDVVMPGINGKILAETLRKTRPEIRIVYTSGYTRDVIVHHGVLNPGVLFLDKPYTPQALAAKVREALDAKT